MTMRTRTMRTSRSAIEATCNNMEDAGLSGGGTDWRHWECKP